MIVVLGATGHTGSVVAETVLERKQPVRVVVRSADKGAVWAAKGAEVAVASLDDQAALTKALRGASGAYLLIPPNYGATSWLAEQRRRIDRIAEAVKASEVAHVVLLSSIGGHLAEGTGPIRASRYGEQTLTSVARNVTILRPGYFMDNWASGIGMAKGQGLLPSFIPPQAKVPMIFTRDIGRVAAERLMAGGRGHAVVELAGPEEYSPEQVADCARPDSWASGRRSGRRRSARWCRHSPHSGFPPKRLDCSKKCTHRFQERAIGYERPKSLVRGTFSLAEALREMV
jgi:uncharacterized protein YbjT (DUF2867 family)